MRNTNDANCVELNFNELTMVNGGGPVKRAAQWYYMTVGSFYRGIYDGLMGNEPLV